MSTQSLFFTSEGLRLRQMAKRLSWRSYLWFTVITAEPAQAFHVCYPLAFTYAEPNRGSVLAATRKKRAASVVYVRLLPTCACRNGGRNREITLIDWCRLSVWLETRATEQLPPVAWQQQDPSILNSLTFPPPCDIHQHTPHLTSAQHPWRCLRSLSLPVSLQHDMYMHTMHT